MVCGGPFMCSLCYTGYATLNGSCDCTIKNCYTCKKDTSGNFCISCVPGWNPSVSGTTCNPRCSDNCTCTKPNTCNGCVKGYSYDANKNCVPNCLKNCFSCNPENPNECY